MQTTPRSTTGCGEGGVVRQIVLHELEFAHQQRLKPVLGKLVDVDALFLPMGPLGDAVGTASEGELSVIGGSSPLGAEN